MSVNFNHLTFENFNSTQFHDPINKFDHETM